MPSSSGWSSLFHVGAKTWRPKTADQSYLEHEKKKCAEEAERKQAEVKQKIELLNQVRKLEAKTQALNEMALSAEIQTKEHQLAMRERQMAESRQIELAKLELAKRMGQESLDEADFARIRRHRMKAELLARASNNHAMEELSRSVGHSEFNEPMPPPSFIQSDGLGMPMPPHSSRAGSIPIPGPTPIPQLMTPAPMSVPGSSFLPGPMSMPGHFHLSPAGLYPTYGYSDERPIIAHGRPRRMSDSLAVHPANFGPGEWTSSNYRFPEPSHYLPDYPGPHSAYPGHRNPQEPIAIEMTLRAQAERLRRKRLESLDLNARQHSLKVQALRELRLRELKSRLRERGIAQREIEAQATKMAELDARLTDTELRELREREYRLMLKEKGLQEREISEHLRRREEADRRILQQELNRLERDLRRKELWDAERAIRRAQEKGESPPMGIKRPSREEIEKEGLLDDLLIEFQELKPHLRHEILSMSARHRPQASSNAHRPRFPSMSTLNHPYPTRTPISKTHESILKQPGNHVGSFPVTRTFDGQVIREDPNRVSTRPESRATSRLQDPEPASRPLSRSNSTRQGNSSGQSRLGISSRPPSRDLGLEDPSINLNHHQSTLLHQYQNERIEQVSRMKQPGNHLGSFAAPRALDGELIWEDLNRVDDRPESRATSRVRDHEPASRPLSRSNSIRQGNDRGQSGLGGMSSRPPSRGPGLEDPSINLDHYQRVPVHQYENEKVEQISRNASLPNDDTLAARLQSAAVNSEINGGRRSRSNSRVSQIGDENPSMSRYREVDPSPLNPHGGRRSCAGTISEQINAQTLRSGPNPASSEFLSGRRSRANSATQSYGTSFHPQMTNEQINTGLGHLSSSNDGDLLAGEEVTRSRNSRPPSQMNMVGNCHVQRKHNALSDEELSKLDTPQLEMLLAGCHIDHSLFDNDALGIKNLTDAEINQMSTEQLDALLAGGSSTSDINDLQVGGSRSQIMDGLPQPPIARGTASSSSFQCQPSINRGSIDPPRSLSRGRASSIHQPVVGRRNSRDGVHANSPINHSTSNSPRSSRSLYSMPDQHDSSMYDRQNGNDYRDDDVNKSNHMHTRHPQQFEGSIDNEFTITEMPEQEGTRIAQRLGNVEANSRDDSGNLIDTDEAGLNERNSMHRAVKNLITAASRLGANGIVSLRLNDLEDGSYVASGEAVLLSKS